MPCLNCGTPRTPWRRSPEPGLRRLAGCASSASPRSTAGRGRPSRRVRTVRCAPRRFLRLLAVVITGKGSGHSSSDLGRIGRSQRCCRHVIGNHASSLAHSTRVGRRTPADHPPASAHADGDPLDHRLDDEVERLLLGQVCTLRDRETVVRLGDRGHLRPAQGSVGPPNASRSPWTTRSAGQPRPAPAAGSSRVSRADAAGRPGRRSPPRRASAASRHATRAPALRPPSTIGVRTRIALTQATVTSSSSGWARGNPLAGHVPRLLDPEHRDALAGKCTRPAPPGRASPRPCRPRDRAPGLRRVAETGRRAAAHRLVGRDDPYSVHRSVPQSSVGQSRPLASSASGSTRSAPLFRYVVDRGRDGNAVEPPRCGRHQDRAHGCRPVTFGVEPGVVGGRARRASASGRGCGPARPLRCGDHRRRPEEGTRSVGSSASACRARSRTAPPSPGHRRPRGG